MIDLVDRLLRGLFKKVFCLAPFLISLDQAYFFHVINTLAGHVSLPTKNI